MSGKPGPHLKPERTAASVEHELAPRLQERISAMSGLRRIGAQRVGGGAGVDASVAVPAGSVQVHLRLSTADADLLRSIAAQRDQKLSAVVRSLLRIHAAHLRSQRL